MSRGLIAIVGPTASGKSELALRLCRALDGEIVGTDSVQIYRRFDIGSAKPTAAERAEVPHHLVDVLEPSDPADAARFVELAEACVADIRGRGKQPVLCGGTFLWLRALVYGLAEAPAADPAIRARHRDEAERFGRAHLHARLAAVDPVSFAHLQPNDLVRVSRALEVYELTGEPLSAVQERHGFKTPRHPVRLVGITHPRDQLDERIQRRVVAMFQAGWLEEVQGLLRDGYRDARPLRSVGYRQLAEALTSGSPIVVPELIEQVVRATRTFVRRQLTWLRDEPVRWLAPGELDAAGELLRRDPLSA